MKKFISCCNIRDRDGRIYFPELLWGCMYNLIGASSKEVERHLLLKEAHASILKKYKDLRTDDLNYTFDKLVGIKEFDWKKDGFTVHQFRMAGLIQAAWKKYCRRKNVRIIVPPLVDS